MGWKKKKKKKKGRFSGISAAEILRVLAIFQMFVPRTLWGIRAALSCLYSPKSQYFGRLYCPYSPY